MIFYDVFHQVFWTILSFFCFYFLIHKYVVFNLERIFKNRSNYINKLTLQINQMNKKVEDLEDISHKIINEEIPNKQKFYIEKKLEPILEAIAIVEVAKRDRLKEKLNHQINAVENHSINNDVNLINQLKIISHVIIAKNELKKNGSKKNRGDNEQHN